MKHFRFLLAMALLWMPLLMFAQYEPLTKTNKIEIPKTEIGKLKTGALPKYEGEKLPVMQQAPLMRAAAFSSIDELAGFYIQKNYDLSGNTRNPAISINPASDNTITIENFSGLGKNITATVDLENNKITITPQIVYESTSTILYIYSFDAETGKIDTKASIEGSISKEGITLKGWGCFSKDGKSYASLYAMSELLPYNAIMTTVNYSDKAENDFPVYIAQPYDNVLKIANFGNTGAEVIVNLYSDKKFTINSQFMFSNSNYGDFYCYYTDWKEQKYSATFPITGNGTDNNLKLGNWGILHIGSSIIVAGEYGSSSISTNGITIKYPKVQEAVFEGNGTQASPYLIKTMDNLIALQQSVNNITGTPNNYKGKFFRLENNLDAKTGGSSQLLPIGNALNYCRFAGTFDGNGKKISNLTLNVPSPGLCGLFGAIDPAGAVKNLTLENIDYTASGEYVGGIAGASFGPITQCKVTGTIRANAKNVGGVVGYLENTISNSSFEGTITAAGNVAGVVALTYGNVSNCWAHANIACSYAPNTRYMGGVVGGIFGNQTGAKMNDCYFSGMIIDYVDQNTDNGTISYEGGVAGLLYKSEMRRCFNAGNIIGTASSGQTAGVAGMLMSAKVIDCYNSGTITNMNSEHTAGIVGYTFEIETNVYSTIQNVYSSGNVATKSTFGYKEIVGEMRPGDTLENFYFDGRNYGTTIPGYGRTTLQMTKIENMKGFDASVWNFTEGVYPRLKGIDENNAAYLSMATMLLAENEFPAKVKSPFKVTTGNGITWSVLNNGKQSTEGHGIVINGNQIQLKSVFATDTLYAFNANKEFKNYVINSVAKVFDGNGSTNDPYLIRTLNDLKTLATITVDNVQHYEGDYFLMTNDIDVANDESFIGIAADGIPGHYFAGSFDGGGYTIHNFKVKSVTYLTSGKADEANSRSAAGFIGYLSPTGTLKNLNMAKDCSFEFWAFSAPFVGYNGGTIENCKNYADVTGTSAYIGGITGYSESAQAMVRKCFNAGTITGGYHNVGGIVGINFGNIEICQNNGDVNAKGVSKTYKDGDQYNAGGITGNNYGEIRDVLNTGNVASYKNIGGIAGVNYARNSVGSILRSINYGYIDPLTDISTCGSIVGALESKTEMKDNYFDLQIVLTEGANDATTPGCNGVNTNVLTSGTLSGFDTENIWNMPAGAYPLLKLFKDDPKSVAVSNMFVSFADGENRISVKTNATLNKNNELTWKLGQAEQFKINEQTLNLTLPENDIALDTLTATYGEYQKEFYLRAVPAILTGKGTKAEPWLVKTAADMEKIAKFSVAKVDFNHEYFRVENDIDFTGADYQPIAADADLLKFQGYFDGNGKKFTNLVYKSPEPLAFKTGRFKGLFGIVGSNGTIANLTLEESSSFLAFGYTGGFVGGLRGKVINCVNKATVSTVGGANNVGGIAGQVFEGASIQNCSNYAAITANTGTTAGIAGTTDINTLIKDCSNAGTITSAAASSGSNAGIVAVNGGTIENCTNEGQINANSSNVAGIAAKNNANATIIKCNNKGTITGNASLGAGIVSATSSDNVIKDCINTGEINATASVGGIIGQSKANAVLTVDNCYNTGKVNATKSTNAGGIIASISAGTIIRDCWNEGEITGSGTVGGVVGASSGSATIATLVKRCYNTGKVTSKAADAGGVIAKISSNVEVDSCYNVADVYAATNNAGGITASNGLYLSNCWNSGNVTAGVSHSAGISALGLGEIVNCVNLGNVTVEGNTDKNINAGGIIAKTRAILTNCYNMGNVTAYDQAGGLYGQIFDNGAKAEAYQCYNTGKVTITKPDSKNIGNIVGLNPSFLECEDVYYDKDKATGEYENDKDAEALSTKSITTLDLGEDWVTGIATYPTLKTLEKSEVPNLYAATIILQDGDSFENVSNHFQVGTPAGVNWSASDHITFSGNDARVDENTKATITLTATAGDYKKNYTLVLNTKTVGISQEAIDKVVVKRIYYTPNGMKVENPVQGINIVVTIYDDGTVENSKIYMNESAR